MLRRKQNWESLLDRFLIINRTRTFAYGDWDCCLFAADAIQVMTGVDIAERFRGQYRSARGAMQVVLEYCGRRSISAVAQKTAEAFLMPEVKPLMAGRGDMVLIKRSRDYSLGIVSLTGRHIIIPTAEELWKVEIQQAVRSWRV